MYEFSAYSEYKNAFDKIKGSLEGLQGSSVLVHCAAGLNRSPRMLLVILTELGMTHEEAIASLSAMKGFLPEHELLRLNHVSSHLTEFSAEALA
jgi:protein-tyrosine phosphatase